MARGVASEGLAAGSSRFSAWAGCCGDADPADYGDEDAAQLERQMADEAARAGHGRFGALELVTAWTPAHSNPATLTYRLDVDDRVLRAAMGDPAAALPIARPDLKLRADDVDAMQRLQHRIEAGERFMIVGPPEKGEDGAVIPLGRLES